MQCLALLPVPHTVLRELPSVLNDSKRFRSFPLGLCLPLQIRARIRSGWHNYDKNELPRAHATLQALTVLRFAFSYSRGLPQTHQMGGNRCDLLQSEPDEWRHLTVCSSIWHIIARLFACRRCVWFGWYLKVVTCVLLRCALQAARRGMPICLARTW